MVKTMFGSAKHKYLSDMISLQNPASARGSIRELNKEFDKAYTRTKKLRIARATRLAANRADASRRKVRMSPRERQEFAEVARLYSNAATRMFLELKQERR